MSGWPQVLEELLDARGRELKRYAFVLCGSHDEANDLVQEALVKVLSRPAVGRLRSAEAFVKKVIANEFIDRARARGRWSRYLSRLVPVADHDDWTTGVERAGAVRSALDVLSRQQRLCVVLRYYEDLTVPQIAGVMGCSDGTVKRYLSDALARLKPQLHGERLATKEA